MKCYNQFKGRFTSVDPLTASATIRNPQTLNRYAYALNSPYKFTDPFGALPVSQNTIFGGCGAKLLSCSDNEENVFFIKNEMIVLDLNIVYDCNQMSEEAARESMKATIEDLQMTFSAINVQLNITLIAGSADMSSQDNTWCANCGYDITSDAVNGAVNVFLNYNTKNPSQAVSYF
ncbi:MAG TPA: hypothetical protein VNJ29_02110 [Candidatus Nitrosotenuis sp.]|nr:hypothetical protein [Candidatus Nitrosotenuis sp.]